ncbi:MAG: TnsA endonuclease N-terminal domain-containing protein, partial [Acetobacteraceae bacterium]
LERDFLILLTMAPNLADILEQPVHLEWKDKTGRTHPYTPDYLVTFGERRDQRMLFEIKYQVDLQADWNTLKYGFVTARRFARANGMTFHVMTEVQIFGPFLENARFLRRYRVIERNAAAEEHLVSTLAVLGETSAQALLAAAYASSENRIEAIAPLWRLVATGRVHADLFKPLTMATPLWVIVGEGYIWQDPHSIRSFPVRRSR